MARTQGNVYKAIHIAMKRYEKDKPEKERDDWPFLAILYSLNNSILTLASEVFWQASHR